MLAAADIVITTYKILREDYRQLHNTERSFADRQQQNWLDHFPLLVVLWKLVFFDEAQKMSNADTGNWKAANALHRNFTLPFSGMPIQNEYSEVLSMMQLMQAKPLGNPVFFKEMRTASHRSNSLITHTSGWDFPIPPPNKTSAKAHKTMLTDLSVVVNMRRSPCPWYHIMMSDGSTGTRIL